MRYPAPDRSNYIPNFKKTADCDWVDIGYAVGELSDGRPWRLECWAADQCTYSTLRFSSEGLPEMDQNAMREFLVSEGMLKLGPSDAHSGTSWVKEDPSGNSMYEVFVLVGMEERSYSSVPVPLKDYENQHTV